MNPSVLKASTVAFVASFCTLVIELVAGRIMAPYVGVSLYTWTSIIGVVLAGISLGAYVGGLLADRFPTYRTLGWLLLLSGLASLSIAPLADAVGGSGMLVFKVPLVVRILALTTIVFMVPAFILGMISPVVVRLTVSNLAKTGNVVGRIYAFSTLGSILGTFATGFFLIDWMGTRTLLYAVGAILVCSAPIFGGFLSGRGAARTGVVAGALLLLGATLAVLWQLREVIARPPGLDQSYYYFKESDYFTIKVLQDYDHGEPIRTLVLDHLIHSYTHPDDPFYLKYDYLRIYEELVAWQRSKKDRNDFLFIGGGGYTLPRYFDARYPKSRVDVVEIDPWVSHVATEELGVKGTRINTFNEDGRYWVMNRQDQYDFIFGDAFNDLSIPYHLTTKEFNDHLKRVLKPDGLLMCLVIDNVAKGDFIPSYMKTLQASFGADNVALININDSKLEDIGTSTAIIVASQQPLDYADFEKYLADRASHHQAILNAGWALNPDRMPLGIWPSQYFRKTSHVSKPAVVNEYLQARMNRRRKPIILTDDYVPTDNLVAPMFEERFGYKKQ